MGIGGVLKLTLALMTASLFISVSTVGDLSEAITESFENIQNATDYTVEVEDVEALSQSAKFVRQRAGNDGCKDSNGKGWNTVPQQNENGGYPALSDSYLGQKPNCFGTASTLARGNGVVGSAQSAIYEEGQDMEGIYSRVRFEVTEPMAIETSENSGSNTWLEDRLVGVSRIGFNENTMTHGECKNAGAASAYLGMGSHYVMYFQPDQAHKEPHRADKWMQEFADRLENRAYCHPDGEAYEFQQITISELDQHPVISATRRLENKVVLCPGDRGYIQMNKKTPMERAEVGESWAGTSANFPYIQITNLGTSTNSTCLPAEMEPAAEFEEVVGVERIELPNEMDEQLGSMVPDKIENAYKGFIEGVWEDSFADKTVGAINDQLGSAAGYIESGVNAVIDGAVDIVGGTLGAIAEAIPGPWGDDTPDDIGEFLNDKGVDPIQDMFSNTVSAVSETMDGQMKDSLHVQLSFTNKHVDMDDDAFPADFRGGFRILFWEGGDDEEVNGKFEIEPAGGLYDEDVPQGVEGAGELDALQSGWLDGNGGIKDLGCYIKAELVMEQKRTSMDYPDRAEQVWDIYIGDLEDAGSSSSTKSDCSGRDGRIEGERAGVAWGGLSTLGNLEVEANDYYPEEEELEVTATATANEEGDGDIDGGTLEVGINQGATFNMEEFDNTCEGDSCSITTNISNIESDESPNVEARFIRNDEPESETVSPDLSSFFPAEEVLGPEEWNWDSQYNSSTGLYNVSVTFGDDPDEGRSTDLDSGRIEVMNVSGSNNVIQQADCSSSEWNTDCKAEMTQIPAASSGELELNSTITMDGAMHWDSKTLTPP
jgi:hypothetical protein